MVYAVSNTRKVTGLTGQLCSISTGLIQGRPNSIIGLGQNSALGPLPTQPLTGIKM
jgi:hypothetical protein